MRKFLLLVFLFACTTLSGYAQWGEPAFGRSIRQALAKEKTDTGRISLSQKLARHYLTVYALSQKQAHADTAMDLLKQTVKQSEAIHNNDLKYAAFRLIGVAHIFMKDTATARPYLIQAFNYYAGSRQYDKAVFIWLKWGDAASRDPLFYPLAMQCYRQALAIELANNLHTDELAIRLAMMQLEYNRSDYNAVIKEASAAITAMKGRKENLDRLYLMLARIYRYKGDLKRSLTYNLAGVSDMELYKDTVFADPAYAELALTYDILGQPQKSIDYYRKLMETRYRQPAPDAFIFRTVGFMIKNLVKLGKPKEALAEARYVEKRRQPQTSLGRSCLAQNYAYCYEALKNYPAAEKYYLEMVKWVDLNEMDDEITMLACYDICSFYVARHQYNKAQFYADKMRGSGASFSNYKDFELLRFRVDSAVGNYKSALLHYSNYQHAKDSLFSESKSREIEELQIKYETKQKVQAIELLRKDSELQRRQVKQANYIRNITFVGIILVLAVLGLLYYSYRANQKKSTEINQKNAFLNQLLTEKDNLLDEKEWLMKEVHHRVKNNLQIVMGLLQRQSSFIDNKDALSAIRNSEHRMHSIALIHQKLYQSESLTLVNMKDYIGEMIGYLRESFDLGVHIRFEKDIDDIDFDINVAVPLGLLLNEAITNAIKYAFPTHESGCVRVSLKQTADACYSLRIVDNGQGVPAGLDVKKTNSMGFNLMRGLSKQVGGSFNILTESGVTLIIDFCPEQHGRNS